ncbi:hypothetical protein COK01_24835 [Priestia megaterium]|nr:hypothetical protein COK01_24835 [Priestia megaterium]
MLIIIRNSLIIAVCLYLASVFLPEVMNVNENVAKYLFVIPVGIWGITSKNKWWINLISFSSYYSNFFFGFITRKHAVKDKSKKLYIRLKAPTREPFSC